MPFSKIIRNLVYLSLVIATALKTSFAEQHHDDQLEAVRHILPGHGANRVCHRPLQHIDLLLQRGLRLPGRAVSRCGQGPAVEVPPGWARAPGMQFKIILFPPNFINS